jgi:hypothetical protein
LRPSPQAVLAIIFPPSELFFSFLLFVPRPFVFPHGAFTASRHHQPVRVGALDGDAAGLNELVSAGQLAANEDGRPAEWIVPPAGDHAPNPPSGYVVSFTRFHERGFAASASRFMWALCHHYGVELHNFAPNAISHAATFVCICEGYLGIPVNWDLWIHLFHAELFTQPTSEQRTRRAVRAGGMSLALRGQHKDYYIPCTMTTNNAGWEQGWFYLRNGEPGLPLHWFGAPGEARLLAPRGVPAPAPESVGLASGRAEESGGPRADRGGRPCRRSDRA